MVKKQLFLPRACVCVCDPCKAQQNQGGRYQLASLPSLRLAQAAVEAKENIPEHRHVCTRAPASSLLHSLTHSAVTHLGTSSTAGQERAETLTGGQLGQGHTAGVRKSPQRNLGLVLSVNHSDSPSSAHTPPCGASLRLEELFLE